MSIFLSLFVTGKQITEKKQCEGVKIKVVLLVIFPE